MRYTPRKHCPRVRRVGRKLMPDDIGSMDFDMDHGTRGWGGSQYEKQVR